MITEDLSAKFGSGQIYNFRCNVFKEHFDMSFNDCSNIHTYWDNFNKYAKDNAAIYR
jgi:hypothetical protein